MNEFLQYVIKNNAIDNELVTFFSYTGRKKAFFGAGRQARVCLDFNLFFENSLDALIVTKRCERHTNFPGDDLLRMYEVADFNTDDCEKFDVLITVNESLNNEIKRLLEHQGFIHIYSHNNWQSFNEQVRELYFNWEFERRGISLENEFIEVDKFKIRNYKMINIFEYRTNLFTEFFDILLPALWDDTTKCIEGSFELGECKLCNSDIVIDAGANIGLFSCYAASVIGDDGIVFSFEPTPSTCNLLSMNIEGYSNIKLVEKALSDSCGITKFSVSTLDDGGNSRNTLFDERVGDEYKSITVEVTTIDDFVRDNKLKKIDFIKADIEGAERNMLMGAIDTLKRYAPKLSICTYHFKDDPIVLEKIIREANPNYVIVHKWQKLYAYVPKTKKNDDGKL